jgi:voltage-gated potassium channel Kch
MSNVKKLIFGHSEPVHLPRPALKNQVFILLRIWRNYSHDDYSLERILRLFLAASQFLSISLYIRHIFGKWGWHQRKMAIEMYVLMKVLFPVFVLATHHQNAQWIVYVSVYFIVETVIYLASLIFLGDASRESISPRRSLLLLFLNFFEIVFQFALIYGHFGALYDDFFSVPVKSGMDAVYFSFVTAATVGYGDVVPIADLCKQFVIVQITLTFVFVALFMNYFINLLHKVNHYEQKITFRKTRRNKA